MKPKIFIYFFIYFFAISAQAQDVESNKQEQNKFKNNFNINYGLLSNQQFLFLLSSVYQSAFSNINEDNYDQRIKSIGSIGLKYDYQINKTFLVGMQYNNNYIKSKLNYKNPLYSSLVIKSKVNFLGINSSAKYFHKNQLHLYSGVALGVGIYSGKEIKDSHIEKYRGTRFAWHANLFGLRYGDRVGGFVELGVGYKGIMNVGVVGSF